jgi:hypothetical protein
LFPCRLLPCVFDISSRGQERRVNQEDVTQRHTSQGAAFLGMLLAAAAAVAQNNPAVLKADIPFPFVVANHTLPAGHYAVSSLTFVLTSRVDGHAPESSGKLGFYRYEGDVFPDAGLGSRQPHRKTDLQVSR